MSIQAIHDRAERLIAQDLIEGISEIDRRWLEEHLRGCEQCSHSAATVGRALHALRSIATPVPSGLAQRTQFRLRLRMQEQQAVKARQGVWWIACAVSWAFGAVSASYVWQGLQWATQRMALPRFVPELTFGLWWALPAIVAGAIVLAENARDRRQRDGMS
jgi:hypothetical protein